MKKVLRESWKYLIVVIWFIASIVFFEHILNIGSTDVTKKMSAASLPVMCMRYNEYEYNRMFGYKTEMDYSLIRDGVTPMEEGRQVFFRIYKYGESIDSIEYKLYSIDKSRYIEEGEIKKTNESSEYIDASVTLKDLIEYNTDYSLQFILTMKSGEKAYYYARVYRNDELDFYEKLEYVYSFSDATFNKDTAEQEIGIYLESNKSGDNTTFTHVNIHSSLDQVTWGNLNPKRTSRVICTIEEIDKKSAKMRLDYLIEGGADEVKPYSVIEEFRFIKGSDRMYLMEYDRYMDSFIFADNGIVYGDKLMLGITYPEFEYLESEDGNTFAFSNNKSLFSVNSSSNTFGAIYSFYDTKNFDERTINNSHDIKIINIDESGNILFYVYGYFNRGDYEGQVGVNLFEYNAVLNVVEEKAFLSYSKPYEVLKEDVNKLGYLNERNEFIMYLDGFLYRVNLENSETTVIASCLPSQDLFVSPEQNMIAWKSADNDKKITFMNIEDSKSFNIEAATRECVIPLGFMGEDLILGKAYQDDISTDAFGQVTYPMYEIVIINKNNVVLKRYSQENAFVTKCKINENLITLTRVTKDENNEFEAMAPDSIVNTQMTRVYKNTVEVITTENLKKIVQIALKKEMDNKKTKYLSPQIGLYEGRKTIEMNSDSYNFEKYYIYVGDKCIGINDDVGEAIVTAEENYGCVLNANGDYVWKKEAYSNTNQIMRIVGQTADDENGSLETCIETILEYEGFTANVKDDIVKGMDATEILEERMEGARSIEIRNCSYESLKYYLNRDIPVILMAGNNTVLITGYSDNVNVWMNPQSGNIMKVGVDEAKKLYEKYGYHFVTYIIPKS